MPQYHYVRLFPADYIRDTRYLSQAEHGAYLLLIVEYYLTGGPLPDDNSYLSRTTRCDSVEEWRTRVRPKMEPFFHVENGYWQHKRCDAEIAEAILSRSYRVAGADATNAIRRERSALRSACDSATRSALKPELELESESKPKPKSKTLAVRDEKAVPDSLAEPKRKKPRLASAPGMQTKTGPTWHAYAAAYEAKYKERPLWNGKVGGLLSRFIDQVGEDAAPKIAEFFVWHEGVWYGRRMHQVECLAQDAAKLHTEWKTGRRMTEKAAKEKDRLQERGDTWQQILDENRVAGRVNA